LGNLIPGHHFVLKKTNDSYYKSVTYVPAQVLPMYLVYTPSLAVCAVRFLQPGSGRGLVLDWLCSIPYLF
ncbi:MAG: hypothetical protein ACYCQI_07920, partial [Gammaproteobacteria bacterium]